MADKYDKLLTDYFNGTLDKHVASYEVSDWFLEEHRAEYEDMRRVRSTIDDVVHDTLKPFYQNVLKAKYGDRMTFDELQTMFDRTPTAINKQKYRVKRKLKEAGL
ncbi:sigma-70 family RNA polymerase sigma factor [Weissella cibaria]|uniref:sigma-70 family RNA polymerase sigma factor n=1 Tax=Weissella cibaria TaxID=137591 RepID=UPI00106E8113|nr:sigma-70 family RNA polymerase sigma factor [Weissella cibaria]